MKQNRTAPAAFDLDDLERELNKAAAPRQVAPAGASVDDPLAELARIVGQDQAQGLARNAPRDPFEAFLAAAEPVSGAKQRFPTVEPLFPAGLPQSTPPASELAFPQPSPVPPMVETSPRESYLDPLEALLAQDLGLRSGLDEVPAPQRQESAAAIDAHVAFEARLPEAAAIGRSTAEEELAPQELAPQGLAPKEVVAQVVEPQEPVVAQQRPANAPFDDMIAEFEAAIRDTAGHAVQGRPAIADPMIAPPPGDIVVPPAAPPAIEPPPVAQQISGADVAAVGGGVAAASLAAAAVGRGKPRRGMMLAGGVIAVAVIGLGALALSGGGKSTRPAGGPVPVIEARSGVTKERPANPGGVEVPDQDKEILQPRTAETNRPERVAPREEQPLDLTQAQRQAAAAAQPSGVRQIPGVGIVAPSTGAPQAAVQTAPAEAAPRPVASVPIVISGQTPSASMTTAPPVSTTPMTAPPVAAAPPAPAVAPQASAPLPQAAAPARAPAPPAASAQPPAEPRRVRSVPIRPENGEAAPQRAQTQPRVVPPAAATAPSDPSGPLSITPQGSRGPAQQAAPTRQAAAPAQGGIVPSSVPSLSDPEPAAPEPSRTASTGSGFAVQLAAEGSEDAARAKFNRIRSQYGSVLGSSSPSIRSAEVNGRNVYRVRVGNMSREDAVGMCERLKASGGTCFVARN